MDASSIAEYQQLHPWMGSRAPPDIHESFTVERYNRVMHRRLAAKQGQLRSLLLLTGASGLTMSGSPVIVDALGAAFYALKLNWLIPIPYLLLHNIGAQLVEEKDVIIDVGGITANRDQLDDKTLTFTIVTRGFNILTVEKTVASVRHWVRRVAERHGLSINHSVWVVTEQDAYDAFQERYDELERLGATLVIVPPDYETPGGTKFKARALQFAAEERRRLGLNGENDWVYHQDEETVVGEDTILGLLDFISRASPDIKYGAGVILYPRHWEDNVTAYEELPRSFTDYSLSGQGNLKQFGLFWYHGSHFLVRADVEESVGWDFGPVRSEDYIFSIKMRERYGRCMSPMKGFAYECPPFSVKDHLKQRRRWVLGNMEIMQRRDIPARHKARLLYGLVSWFSAIPSLLAFLLSIVYPTGGMGLLGGLTTGIVWYTIVNTYVSGYDMHRDYVEKKHRGVTGAAKTVLNIMVGLLVEAVAPWYALLRRTQSFETIAKDKEPPIRAAELTKEYTVQVPTR